MEAEPTRVAAVTDDGRTICAHFGRARHYLVCTIEEGRIVAQDLRDKAGHHVFSSATKAHGPHGGSHGQGLEAAARHVAMIAPLADCEALLSRGMGRGAYAALKEAGIRPVVTDEEDIAAAVQAYIEGRIVDHVERLH
jgi:predicted Fe-Mo cluster-binding NifX family protein